jgi:succinoglycan biosynthesis transport protein ExoP
MPEFTGTKDLRTYLRILWRWKVVFLVFLVGSPVAAYLYERGQPKEYKASALVGVNSETVDATLLGSGGSFSTTNVQAVAQLVTTRPVAQAAAKLMNPPADPNQIVGEVTASADTTTNFLTINAIDRSPTRAAEIANAFARAIGLNRQLSAINELNAAIKGIKAQIARLGSPAPSSPQATQLAQLQGQLSQYRAAKATQTSNAAILQSAVPPSTPASPQPRRTVELALLIGLLLGIGAVVLAENADRRLRKPDDLEQIADVPLLATIPPSAFSSKLDTGPADEEAFQMLRTSLLYFNPANVHQSVVITSPGEKDGKTTIAIRLALSAARAGLRVVLVDADLRRAQIAPRLGIEAKRGLSAVLTDGGSTSGGVLFRYPIDEPGARALTVLPAGLPAANPAALIGSPHMKRVIKRLEANADLVVIDSPAALMVSDPLPLMEIATGVVLVARMNRSSRDKIKRLEKMVRAAKGTLFGVVATGVSTGIGYDYYTSAYYGGNGQRRWFGRRRKTLRYAEDLAGSAPVAEAAEPLGKNGSGQDSEAAELATAHVAPPSSASLGGDSGQVAEEVEPPAAEGSAPPSEGADPGSPRAPLSPDD